MQFVEDELEKRPEAVQMEALLDARPDNGDMLSGDELAAPPSACFDACGDELMEVTSSVQSSSGGRTGVLCALSRVRWLQCLLRHGAPARGALALE